MFFQIFFDMTRGIQIYQIFYHQGFFDLYVERGKNGWVGGFCKPCLAGSLPNNACVGSLAVPRTLVTRPGARAKTTRSEILVILQYSTLRPKYTFMFRFETQMPFHSKEKRAPKFAQFDEVFMQRKIYTNINIFTQRFLFLAKTHVLF
jgi:hypothetical protein